MKGINFKKLFGIILLVIIFGLFFQTKFVLAQNQCSNGATNYPKCTTKDGKCINNAVNPPECTKICDPKFPRQYPECLVGVLVLYTDNSINGENITSKITAILNTASPLLKNGGEVIYFGSFPTTNVTFTPDQQNKSDFTTKYPHTCILSAGDKPSCSVNFSAPRKNTSGNTASYKINTFVYLNTTEFGDGNTSTNNSYIITNIPETYAVIKDNFIDITATYDESGSDTTYKLLAPLPIIGGEIETKEECAFGKYLNTIIKIILGIAAVLAVVMITMGGIEYMSSDLISSKEAGKESIINAVLGLLLALSAYIILNTINPRLLEACLKLPEVKIEYKEFSLGGGATFDGKPIKVKFNEEAYPAAKNASQKTGVETAFILAIFAQETGSGVNTGSCNYQNASMGPGQLDALKKIATDLNMDYTKINMSCKSTGSSYGGAIGLTQFIPTTWDEHRKEASGYLGHEPNPWNINDALMMTAVFLKNKGGAGNDPAKQEQAACKYFGSCNVNVHCENTMKTYGQCVMGKKLSIEQQIQALIAEGKISP